MIELGKYLMVIGLVITVVGALLWLGIGKGWPSRLRNDILCGTKRREPLTWPQCSTELEDRLDGCLFSCDHKVIVTELTIAQIS